MGIDLVSACMFCAGMLLGTELSPRPGLAGELGFSYATLARRWEIGTTVDTSDVTPKFVLVGMGYARFAPAGLGAGTPEFEWRARVGFGPSHDEQQRLVQPELGLPHVFSNGTGRAENFALLVRLPVTAADSLEMAGEGRNNRSTDVINIGGENQELTEARDLSSQRIDAVARLASPLDGARGRGRSPVDQARRVTTRRRGRSTMPPAISSAGKRSCAGNALPGRSSCTASASRGCSTCIGRAFRTFSTGTRRRRRRCRPTGSRPATPGPGRSCWLTATYDRQHLPFVSLAVLGTETVAFDSGFDPYSDNEEMFCDLAFRYAFTPAIRARVGARLAWGDETVTAHRLGRDASDADPGRRAARDLRRRPVGSAGLARAHLLHRGRLLDRRAEAVRAVPGGVGVTRPASLRRGPGGVLNFPRRRSTCTRRTPTSSTTGTAPAGRCSPLARPRRARRRDAAGRPAVAVRQEPLDRPEDPDPAPHGGPRHRLGRHRSAGRRAPRRRNGDAPGPGDRARAS